MSTSGKLKIIGNYKFEEISIKLRIDNVLRQVHNITLQRTNNFNNIKKK